ncbi:hypothetical protein JRQ81_012137 [Phrynocephalus forsythii]|uniref:Uncharacterized protein n=1 Tax=Phrynocephalus forsythii TaxID=171643 RepID=A0A9Q0X772_9SAUR|nr:hypothetical protein JRQ81_012137 [Phrynocephalus forsythii]
MRAEQGDPSTEGSQPDVGLEREVETEGQWGRRLKAAGKRSLRSKDGRRGTDDAALVVEGDSALLAGPQDLTANLDQRKDLVRKGSPHNGTPATAPARDFFPGKLDKDEVSL